MKVAGNITAVALALSLVAGIAMAATSTEDSQVPVENPVYGMMNGQGPQNGLAGPGKRGKGMRGGNQECWQGNGGPGQGQNAMMRGGHGKNRGAMMNPEMREKRDAFLDATVDLRKEMHDKRFAYREAKRNPDLTLGELQKMENAMYSLRQELKAKRVEFFKVQKAE